MVRAEKSEDVPGEEPMQPQALSLRPSQVPAIWVGLGGGLQTEMARGPSLCLPAPFSSRT